MIVRQLSVFLENKSGYLDKVLSLLAMNKIDIKAVFISDTREYGILRILVSNPAILTHFLTKPLLVMICYVLVTAFISKMLFSFLSPEGFSFSLIPEISLHQRLLLL